MRCELYLKRKKNKWMSKCLFNQSKLITQEIRVCLIPRGAQMWAGWCPSENLKRRQGHWRGSEAEDNSALGPLWPFRGCAWVPGGPGKDTFCPLDSDPWGFRGTPPTVCALHLVLLTICKGWSNTQTSQEAWALSPQTEGHWDGSLSSASEGYSYAAFLGLPSTWMEDPGDQSVCQATGPCWGDSGK